jgi:hypothetical protein
MVFLKFKNRIQFTTSNRHSGSQPIENTAEETIEYLKEVYRPDTWEIIEA